MAVAARKDELSHQAAAATQHYDPTVVHPVISPKGTTRSLEKALTLRP